jgi:glutaconate CoA-transferase, subunit B
MPHSKIGFYTVDELMAVCLARTIMNGQTVFNGVAVPLPFTAIMLARKTHAPDCIFWGGLLAGFNPTPPFLPPTSGDSVMMQRANPVLHLSQVFDLAMRGELDRIFFSGAQIDKYGNLNNNYIGSLEKIRVKLPGGAGASHIGCFAKNFTIWSVRHEGKAGSKGKKVYTFVDQVDFVTTVGHKVDGRFREELGIRGKGPDWVVTTLGVFDFDPQSKIMRLKSLHPGVTVQDVLDHTGFEPVLPEKVPETAPPTVKEIEIIRTIDPLNTRKLGFSEEALARKYDV